MKRAKLLSLFLAGSLLFQTAGIDAMASASSEPALISETSESSDNDLSDHSSDNNGEDPNPSNEETKSDQPSSNVGEDVNPSDEEGKPDQPSSNDSENVNPSDEEDKPDQTDQPSSNDGEDATPSDEEEATDQPSNTEGEIENPSDDENEDGIPAEDTEIEETVSENTISENTISENTLPEEAETSLFSIFPGLGDDYKFSSQQLADKKVLSSHVEDIVTIHSTEAVTIEDYKDATGEYELGEVVYLAETKTEAEQVAKAFGGTLDSYSYEVAVITLPPKATVALAVAAAADPDVKLPAVWPNYYSYLHTDTNGTIDSLSPADPAFSKQWQHDYIGSRYAWAAGYKGQGIKVAVIDTGLEQTHEDLQANALPGKTFVDGANGTPQNTDNQTHGTHVAGIIAADDNNLGGRGIAPDANVRGYSVFSTDNRCKTSWIKSAINAAVADGNDIINMSLGSPNYDGDYEKIVNNAYEAGVAIFASSGNDDSDGNNFPAAYASTISVGAVDQNGSRASFSNFGKTVTLSFPGVNIYSTYPTGKGSDSTKNYYSGSGTSQASPAAAGTAAVILSARADIRNKTGKARVSALLSAMKSSTTKCVNSGMGAGTTYLPGVLKIATDMTAPEIPVINIIETTDDGAAIKKNKNAYLTDSINVTLSTKTAVGVNIYYSIDGKTPTYKNGVITNAAIAHPDSTDDPYVYKLGDKIALTGAKSKTIKAIAVNPVSGKVSKVASKTVTLTPIPSGVTVAPVNNVKKIAAGKSLKFTATVTPSYAISSKVAWSVDDKAKAAGITVSNGTVKTQATKTTKTPAGEYTVTATAVGSDGNTFNGQPGSYTFTVIDATAITKVALIDSATKKAPVAKSIKKDETLDLAGYLIVTKTDPATKVKTDHTGADALADVAWSSNNTKVATVSDTGVITAIGPGKAVIKAVSNDGGNKSASYTVTVLQPVQTITISGPTRVASGKAIALTAKVTPANASNKKVVWTISGDGKAVSINKSNGKVTTKKESTGEYTVKATAADGFGGSSNDYKITVVSGEITKITLSAKKLTLFPPKTSASVSATKATLISTIDAKGTDSALSKTLITWTSSSPSIASVDQSGNVTAKAPGKATITCAATDGSNKKATCTVNVTVPMSKLVIGPTDGYDGRIAVGKKIKMVAKYYSNYGTPANKKISWEIVNQSDDVPTDKVTIDKNGTVSVAKDVVPGGSVTVQAIAQDGSGVTSNPFTLYIWPNFVAARLKQIYTTDNDNKISGYFFMVEATASKDTKGKPDWTKAVEIPDYCTATVSGPKNVGLYKDYIVQNGQHYAIYAPQPLKFTTKNLDNLPPVGNVRLTTAECDKITLTVKLKDGSNLKAKTTKYAIQYVNSDNYLVVGYYN